MAGDKQPALYEYLDKKFSGVNDSLKENTAAIASIDGRLKVLEQRERPGGDCRDLIYEIKGECDTKCEQAGKDINELGKKVISKTGYKYVWTLAGSLGGGLLATWLYFISRLDRLEEMIRGLNK